MGLLKISGVKKPLLLSQMKPMLHIQATAFFIVQGIQNSSVKAYLYHDFYHEKLKFTPCIHSALKLLRFIN